MARSTFGGGASDFTFGSYTINGHSVIGLASGTLTMWSAKTGGNQYTDLLVGGTSTDHITVDLDGQIPAFQAPDGVSSVWADAGAGRVLLTANLDRPTEQGIALVNALIYGS